MRLSASPASTSSWSARSLAALFGRPEVLAVVFDGFGMDPNGVSAHCYGMKAIYSNAAAAIALTFGIAACTAGVDAPPPAPTPVAVAVPPPAPPVAAIREPEYRNYLDAPQTPGTWTYANRQGETLALYGEDPRAPLFLMRCTGTAVAIARVTDQANSAPRVMSVTTETVTRQLEAAPVAGSANLLAAPLPPGDPLLDAMAITKGRFAIEVEGERSLYLPAWAEVTRVIEDCR